MEQFAQHQEEKKEHYEELIEKYKAEIEGYNKQDQAYMDANMGSPILVGHHSEGKHRREIERMDRRQQKRSDLYKKIEWAENKIKNIEKPGFINSRDPEVVQKLKAKLEKINEQIADVKEHNKKCKDNIFVVVQGYREGFERLYNGNGSYHEYATIIDGVLKFRSTRTPPKVKEIVETYFKTKKMPEQTPLKDDEKVFESWQLSNLGANKRSVEKRIHELSKKAEINEEAENIEKNGISMEINKDLDRVQLFFPGKPDEEIRTKLKRNGFRWSPRNTCWQAYLKDYNIKFAKVHILGMEELDKPKYDLSKISTEKWYGRQNKRSTTLQKEYKETDDDEVKFIIKVILDGRSVPLE